MIKQQLFLCIEVNLEHRECRNFNFGIGRGRIQSFSLFFKELNSTNRTTGYSQLEMLSITCINLSYLVCGLSLVFLSFYQTKYNDFPSIIKSLYHFTRGWQVRALVISCKHFCYGFNEIYLEDHCSYSYTIRRSLGMPKTLPLHANPICIGINIPGVLL